MKEKILAKNPHGRRGFTISKAKYDVVRESILKSLREKRRLNHTELTDAVVKDLKGTFRGSISWYAEVVKLDLEARKEIERVSGTSPELYRLRRR